MRAARFEYDVQSVVKRSGRISASALWPGRHARLADRGLSLLHSDKSARGTSGTGRRCDRLDGIERSNESACETDFRSRRAFPSVPIRRLPQVQPIVRFVDQLAKKNLLQTWQRPKIPQYTTIEGPGEEIHEALLGNKTPRLALEHAAAQIEESLKSTQRSWTRQSTVQPIQMHRDERRRWWPWIFTTAPKAACSCPSCVPSRPGMPRSVVLHSPARIDLTGFDIKSHVHDPLIDRGFLSVHARSISTTQPLTSPTSARRPLRQSCSDVVNVSACEKVFSTSSKI